VAILVVTVVKALDLLQEVIVMLVFVGPVRESRLCWWRCS
jgi:hypothetical protein